MIKTEDLKFNYNNQVSFNFPDILLNYRLHDNQVTHKGGQGGRNKWNIIRNNIIKNLID